jgi:16S rRNA (adenine1518-N6/adenine1519-N6)-dimethyltransferase
MSPDGLPPLRDVIRDHGLDAKKSLSQNFILDLNLTGRIARAAGPFTGRTVIEIGPGPGGLTRALLSNGAERLIVIEKDERCVPALEQIAAHYPGRLEILREDAMQLDPARLPPGPKVIVGNLPYGIATTLLIGWLTTDPWPPWWESMTLMFQREVAERIVAEPKSKAYGRLSVLSQWLTRPRIAFGLPPEAFTPQPKVSSSVVRFEPIATPTPPCRRQTLETLTAAAFGQRRKMLRVSLKQISTEPEALLRAAGINPEARAEELSVEAFARLAIGMDGSAM